MDAEFLNCFQEVFEHLLIGYLSLHVLKVSILWRQRCMTICLLCHAHRCACQCQWLSMKMDETLSVCAVNLLPLRSVVDFIDGCLASECYQGRS